MEEARRRWGKADLEVHEDVKAGRDFVHAGRRFKPGSGIVMAGRKYIVGPHGELRRLDKLIKSQQRSA